MKVLIASLIPGDEFPPGANYSNAVESVGGTAFFSGRMDQAAAEEAARCFDALILAGGMDIDPSYYGQQPGSRIKPVPRERDETELALARAFLNGGKPILAICRGVQVLNVALGGDLLQHIRDNPACFEHADREMRHEISVVPGTLLAGIFGGARKLTVNSTHHQAMGRIGKGLAVNAVSSDGIVEAVSLGEKVLGVQFHPERILDEGFEPIFAWIVNRCALPARPHAAVP